MTVRIKYQPGFDIYLDKFLEILDSHYRVASQTFTKELGSK